MTWRCAPTPTARSSRAKRPLCSENSPPCSGASALPPRTVKSPFRPAPLPFCSRPIRPLSWAQSSCPPSPAPATTPPAANGANFSNSTPNSTPSLSCNPSPMAAARSAACNWSAFARCAMPGCPSAISPPSKPGQAHGWHTLVYGIMLAVYSWPLRQGLMHYARETMGGLALASRHVSTCDEAALRAAVDQAVSQSPANQITSIASP